MPRIVSSNIKFKGKVGDEVFVDSSRYGHHLRKAPKKGIKKEEPAFKEQLDRTVFLNKLASEINLAVDRYHPAFKEPDFYSRLHKHFRQEPLDIRFFLLKRLKGVEVNDNYPMGKLGDCKYEVKATTKKIIVSLCTEHHPPTSIGRYRSNSYYNSVLLLCWNKPKARATIFQQRTEWIPIAKEMPDFEFDFPKPPGTTHWLLFHRQCLGKNRTEIDSMKAEGMWVADIGSFEKIELAMYEKVTAERDELSKEEKRKQVEEEGEWVKPKRVR